ncbi:RsbRD N-terminal domain-containing protein [Desulfomonile tiedjei]|uniref:RsbRD N-terminal domain-containing protein n=1 Tax=Desulfomonile tiedjei TaxID=2358 RepID=UPI00059E833E|nr:RsbRD N-terminal domain-containing protein [Desulfomonile tiedjei]
MLEDLLIKEKEAIVSKWKDLLVGTYPSETQRFLKTQKNRFANPVGSSIEDGLEGLYNGLIQEGEAETAFFSESLDRIIRVRAVQGFAPSSAVGFVFLLKDAVREVLGKTIRERGLYEELLEFEERLDGLALLAFNIYMQCRETLFEIKASEIRNRTSRLIDRACQKYGMPHEWADSPDTKS